MRTRPNRQVTVSECSIDDLRSEIGSLAEEHWLELEDDKRYADLAIDWPSYIEMEAEGSLISLAARHDGELVGYSVTILCTPLYSEELRTGVNSAIFLRKEHRCGGLGTRMILATESAVRQAGAKMMTWHAKPATSMAHVMEGMGYEVKTSNYSRGI